MAKIEMDVIHSQCAGIDVGSRSHFVAVGQGEKALASFDQALKLARDAGLSKEEADWHKARATALLRLGKLDPAMLEYEQGAGRIEKLAFRIDVNGQPWAFRLPLRWRQAYDRIGQKLVCQTSDKVTRDSPSSTTLAYGRRSCSPRSGLGNATERKRTLNYK